MIQAKGGSRSGLTIALIFVLPAGFFVIARPKHVGPGESQVDVPNLITKMFNMAVVPFITSATFTVSEPMPLKFEQPSPNLFLLAAAKGRYSPTLLGGLPSKLL